MTAKRRTVAPFEWYILGSILRFSRKAPFSTSNLAQSVWLGVRPAKSIGECPSFPLRLTSAPLSIKSTVTLDWSLLKLSSLEWQANKSTNIKLESLPFQDGKKVQRVARKLRSGMVDVNGAGIAVDAPFGGYKHSGIGREAGKEGLIEFLEVKSVGGWS